ncbi:MAG: CoA pyrophosphatase [Candidatus Alcyoniella australis]|nr:CoA pyrophosphatase [Candidatus Alcyoniella australis]
MEQSAQITIDQVDGEIARLRALLNGREVRKVNIEGFRPSAVLLPLQIIDGRPHLLFTQRSGQVENHKYQVSFPGGGADPGESMLQCALRETHEEIGVPPEHVQVLGPLDEIFTISSYTVAPFVGVIPHPFEFNLSQIEIAEIFSVSIEHLLKPEICSVQMHEAPWGNIPIYYYQSDRHTIWGATGRILTQFLHLAYGKPID